MKKAVTILSGGLDSTTATAMARKKYKVVLAVTFDYGQLASERENSSARYFCRMWRIRHKVIKLDFLGKLGDSALTHKKGSLQIMQKGRLPFQSAKMVWVPNRNAIFINVTAAIAEAENIPIIIAGFNREEAETFPDNSAGFVDAINACLKKSTMNHPQVICPTAGMNKTEIIEKAVDLGIDIRRVWCCYLGGRRWCGRCESCLRLIRGCSERAH